MLSITVCSVRLMCDVAKGLTNYDTWCHADASYDNQLSLIYTLL